MAVAVAPAAGLDGPVLSAGGGTTVYPILSMLAAVGAGAWAVVRPKGA